MASYIPTTPLEAAVLEQGRFELATDTAGREVLLVGPPRLPKVVLVRKADGLHELLEAVGTDLGRVFAARAVDDRWEVEPIDGDLEPAPVAAEEYLVMGLRPLRLDGRPVRVVAGRELARLHLVPWTLPSKTVDFGGGSRYLVSATRGVVGDWVVDPEGRRGVVVGISESWVGALERAVEAGSTLALRCDVPVPTVGEGGVVHAVPTTVGAFEVSEARRADDPDADTGTWLAKLPVLLTEGTVVRPALVPRGIETGDAPPGPWELEWDGSSDFAITGLT